MAKNLFPELPGPDDLRTLTDEQVQELLDTHLDAARKIASRDKEFLDGMSQKDILDAYEAGVEQISQLRAEQGLRSASDEEFTARIAELDTKAGVVEPTDEEKATDEVNAEADAIEATEDATEEVAEETAEVTAEDNAEAVEATVEVTVEEPVLAAAPPPEPKAVRRPPLPAPRVENTPIQVNEKMPALIAAGGIVGIEAGSRLGQMELANALLAAAAQQISLPAGHSSKAPVATMHYGDQFPVERILGMDPMENLMKIQNVVGRHALGVNPESGLEAMIASGGLCAPVTPYYELWNGATADRPVRSALAGFNANRGGINVATVPTIEDVTDGVGIKTAAQDAAGGTNAVKTCQVVECPDFTETLLSMIYHCVQFGNLNARAWPEFIAQFNDLVLAAHARLAETALLDGIANASVAVDGSKIYGATSTVINQVLYSVAALRSRFRLPIGYRFRGLFPAWARELIAADVVNTQFERFGVAPGDVDGLLRRYGVEPSWYLDSPTGAGQVFPAQSAGDIQDFPTNIVYYIFPEGSFLFLDGGTLELGIVRDSTLNSTNDFQIFGETFENVSFVGPASYEITTPVCNDGTVAAPATAIECDPSA